MSLDAKEPDIVLTSIALSPLCCVEGCDESKCRSSDGQGGYDCWAGNYDPFVCADGLTPKKTGETHEWQGLTYEGYTCCSSYGEYGNVTCAQRGWMISADFHGPVQPSLSGQYQSRWILHVEGKSA